MTEEKDAIHVRLTHSEIGDVRTGEPVVHNGEDQTVVIDGDEDAVGMQQILFQRRSGPDGNKYVFATEDGREIELEPNDTVSHLQNRL